MFRTVSIGVSSALIATGLMAFAVLGGEERNAEQVNSLPYAIGFALVATALIFGLLVPWATKHSSAQRSNRPAKIGIVSSVVGGLTLVVFWSGLPIILGATGVALGLAGQERASEAGQGRRLALAAVIIGLLAVISAAGITIVEKV